MPFACVIIFEEGKDPQVDIGPVKPNRGRVLNSVNCWIEEGVVNHLFWKDDMSQHAGSLEINTTDSREGWLHVGFFHSVPDATSWAKQKCSEMEEHVFIEPAEDPTSPYYWN